jgi:large subunit ribosomal protein L2
MSIVTRKPRTPSLRHQQYIVGRDLDKKRPEKSLTAPLKRTGGRNVNGRITVRHRGGGAKKTYRIIDFKRTQRDIPGKVTAIEYDPNRNVEIALVVYQNGAKRYVLKTEGITTRDALRSSVSAEVSVGNSLPLSDIPEGFLIHNVELRPNEGGQIAKSAGASVQLMAKEGGLATLKMPSSEVRTVGLGCWATIGSVANADYRNMTIGKAGRTRHLGFRPSVRGIAMNPVDHPMGGGEGRSKSGSHPQSPWGKPCKGTITRKRKSSSIIRRRKSRGK